MQTFIEITKDLATCLGIIGVSIFIGAILHHANPDMMRESDVTGGREC